VTSVVSYSAFQLTSPFIGLCFGHAMSKATQYAIDDNKFCARFFKVNLKEVQFTLQKTIIWSIFFVKGW
jgi:hypothetical protein